MQDAGKGCARWRRHAGLRSDLRLKGTGYGYHEYLLVPRRARFAGLCRESRCLASRGTGPRLGCCLARRRLFPRAGHCVRFWVSRMASSRCLCGLRRADVTAIACGPIIREARIQQDRS